MGMFDELFCEYTLPDPEHQDMRFQTKGVFKLMRWLVITKEGRLYWFKTKTVPVPEEERYYYGKPEWDDSDPAMRDLYRLAGSTKQVPLTEIDLFHDGDLRFYTARGDEWIEYIATFEDGQLVSIKRTDKHFVYGRGPKEGNDGNQEI